MKEAEVPLNENTPEGMFLYPAVLRKECPLQIKQKTPHGDFLCPFADLFRTAFPEIRGNRVQKDYLFTNLIED